MYFLRYRHNKKPDNIQKPFKVILYIILTVLFLVMSFEAVKKLLKGDIGIVTTEKESGKLLYPSVTICPLLIPNYAAFNPNMSLQEIYNDIKKYSENAIVTAQHGFGNKNNT